MKAPLCKICVTTGVFCVNCDNKIKNEDITPSIIDVLKYLYISEEKFKELTNVMVENIFEIDQNEILIVLDSKTPLDNLLIYSLSKYLSSKLSKEIKIINKRDNFKKLIPQVLYPMKILSINQVWIPDGSQEIVIKVSKPEYLKLGLKINKLEQLISKITLSKIRIIY